MQKSDAMTRLQTNIRVLLKARGMTQRDLARDAGIATSNLNRIINGTENVTVDRADRIAKAFGISLSELLDEKLEKLLAIPA